MPKTASRVRRPPPASKTLQGLGDRLRRARAEAGLSQAQLGAPHFTRAYVSAVELGKIRPAVKSLEFMAAQLSKPVSYFLEDEERERSRRERQADTARALQLIAEGRSAAAIEILSRTLSSTTPGPERYQVLRSLGRAYQEAGDAPRAVAVLSDVLRSYEANGDAENVLRTKAQLGAALNLMMSYGEAAQHLEDVLEALARGDLRDPLLKVHVLHNMGVVCYMRSDYAKALQYFERAELEGADIADEKWLASLFAGIGMSRYAVGDFEAAVSYLQKSEALFEAIHNRSRVAEIRFQRGLTLHRIGNRTKARDVLREAEEIAKAADNPILGVRIKVFRAVCDAEAGSVAESVQELESLIPTADALGVPSVRYVARFGLARVLKEHDAVRAEDVLRDAISIVEGTSATGELADAYDEMSEILGRRGLAEEALSYANRAFEIVRPR